jgi:transcriptional regulator GlxA family with amidase domain
LPRVVSKGFVLIAGLAGAVAFVSIIAGVQWASTSDVRELPAELETEEHSRTIAAMKPPKRTRPIVAVVGANAGSETVDYLVPFAVLTQSRVATVVALATGPGPIKLDPALTVDPQATTRQFDKAVPDGADYVIVPALEEPDDPKVVAWIQAQARKGATIVGVCSGVRTLSAAGLLSNRKATGHWHDLPALRKTNPTTNWIANRRYVADAGIITTTGVSAALPVSLALVEAIAGPTRAAALAKELGASSWNEVHQSSDFELTARMILALAK